MYIIDYKYIITEQKKYINFTEMYRKAYPELKKKNNSEWWWWWWRGWLIKGFERLWKAGLPKSNTGK